MPLLIVTLLIAVVSGMFAPRRVAIAVTGLASAATLFAFIWTFADGQGNDPWWILPEAIVGCGIALAVADGLSRRRQHRAAV